MNHFHLIDQMFLKNRHYLKIRLNLCYHFHRLSLKSHLSHYRLMYHLNQLILTRQIGQKYQKIHHYLKTHLIQ